VAKSIQQSKRAVQRAFDGTMAWVDADKPQSLWAFERELWTRLLGIGRAVVLLFLARAARRPRAAKYERDGEAYVIKGKWRTSMLGTRFGKVSFARPVGRKVGARRRACDLPVDRELGLCSGFSLGVVVAMTKLCAQLAFASARQTFEQFCNWKPSPRAVLRMVDAAGAEARAFIDQAPLPTDDGEVLVLQVDGKGAPTISTREHARRARPRRPKSADNGRHHRRRRRREHPRKRRKPGHKSKNAKVAVVGVIYTLRNTDEGLDGPVNKRAIATFKSHRALFEWLHAEAVRVPTPSGTCRGSSSPTPRCASTGTTWPRSYGRPESVCTATAPRKSRRG